MQLHFEEVEKRPNGRLRHNPLSRPVHEIVHAAHAKVHEVEQGDREKSFKQKIKEEKRELKQDREKLTKLIIEQKKQI